MRYFNEKDVQNFKKSIAIENYTVEKKSSSQNLDVFLSHSSKDEEILPSVLNFLSQYEVNVYIDKSDKELPRKTSSNTGKILKDRIEEAKKFVVLVSENSRGSKWIPWELGIADEKKKVENIALLPMVQINSNSDWPEQEYLGLYPRIAYKTFKGQKTPIWMVVDHHTNRGTELGEWIRRR